MVDVICGLIDGAINLLRKLGKSLCRLSDKLDNVMYRLDKRKREKKIHKLMMELYRLDALEKIETRNLKALEYSNNLDKEYVWYVPYWDGKL